VDFYKDKKQNLAISIDEENMLVYLYDCTDNLVNMESEGILQELDADTYDEVNKHFNTDISKYGVKKI
jgi:hypothetical protein